MDEAKNISYQIGKLITQRSYTEALIVYTQIRQKRVYILGLVPLVIKACALIPNIDFGKALQSESIKNGADSDIMVGTSLVTMYAKSGDIYGACKVFDEMPERNVITHNALLGGYLSVGDLKLAWGLFERMESRSAVTWIEMIDGFAKRGDTKKARSLFDQVPVELKTVVCWTVMIDGYACNGGMESARELFERMPQRNNFVWSSMIVGYFKEGDVEEARRVFDRIPIRNVVNWNSLISGYAQNGHAESALEAFGKMQAEGFKPDEVTVVSVLSACAQLGLLDTGKEVHRTINQNGIKKNHYVLNSLLDMYAKCADLTNARLIFEQIVNKNVACWNSMISGFAVHGKSKIALEFFKKMENSNQIPDDITFLAVLSACAHGGFVDDGLEIFAKIESYGVKASVKHYGCLVDLLGRAGRLIEAYSLIKKMPMKPNDAVWGALLAGCQIHMNTDLIARVMKEVSVENLCWVSGDDSHYVLLSNIHAASNGWEKAEKMRIAMVDNGFHKTPGYSRVMLGKAGTVVSFLFDLFTLKSIFF